MTKGLRLFAKLPALSPWEAPFSRRMPSTMMDFRRLPATATVETLPSLPFKTAAFSPIATQGNTHVKAMVNVDRICHGHSPALRAQQSIEDSEIKNPAFPEHGKNDAEQERLFNRPIRAKACFFRLRRIALIFPILRAAFLAAIIAPLYPSRDRAAFLASQQHVLFPPPARRLRPAFHARMGTYGKNICMLINCFPRAYGKSYRATSKTLVDELLPTRVWEILQSRLKNPCG